LLPPGWRDTGSDLGLFTLVEDSDERIAELLADFGSGRACRGLLGRLIQDDSPAAASGSGGKL